MEKRVPWQCEHNMRHMSSPQRARNSIGATIFLIPYASWIDQIGWMEGRDGAEGPRKYVETWFWWMRMLILYVGL